MKTIRTPAIVLVALWLGFLVYLACSAPFLPEQVANHFGLDGQANGWMDRPAHLLLIAGLGTIPPLLMIGIALVIGWVPAPTKLRPSPHLFWTACSWIVLAAGVNFLVAVANQTTPVRLPIAPILLLICGFLTANLMGAASFARHLKEAASASSRR